MTQEQLAQRLGVGKTALSMIETGKARLSSRNRNILVQELNVNPTWIETGKGEMFNADPALSSSFAHGGEMAMPLQSVPLYSIEATAGLVPLFEQQSNYVPINYIHINIIIFFFTIH
jgi:transcriptional regulator with XRE-family HTH domain